MGTGRSISWETSILTAMDDPPFPTLPIGAVAPIVAKAARTLPLPRIPLPRTRVNSDFALRHRALPGGIMGYQDRPLERNARGRGRLEDTRGSLRPCRSRSVSGTARDPAHKNADRLQGFDPGHGRRSLRCRDHLFAQGRPSAALAPRAGLVVLRR